MEQHHQTEVEVHHEGLGEPNEPEDSGKPEVTTKDSRQTEEHQEETVKIPIEDLVEVRILTTDQRGIMTKDNDSKGVQGEGQTRDREVDVEVPLTIQIRGTVQFVKREATTI